MKPGRALQRTARMFLVSEQSYPPKLRQARHFHEETTVTIVLGGSLWEKVGAVEEIARPLSIVVKPAGTEHANEFGAAGARTLQIRIPAAAAIPFSEFDSSLNRWGWQQAGVAVASFAKLLLALRTSADCDALQMYATEALASLCGATERAGGIPGWLKTTRELIDDAQPVPRLSVLAACAGVHPVYLARQFRRTYGCSISEYIQRRRIQKVAELICAGHQNLSSAAHRAGFTDHAHMCRIFRQQIGMAPRQLRAALTG